MGNLFSAFAEWNRKASNLQKGVVFVVCGGIVVVSIVSCCCCLRRQVAAPDMEAGRAPASPPPTPLVPPSPPSCAATDGSARSGMSDVLSSVGSNHVPVHLAGRRSHGSSTAATYGGSGSRSMMSSPGAGGTSYDFGMASGSAASTSLPPASGTCSSSADEGSTYYTPKRSFDETDE